MESITAAFSQTGAQASSQSIMASGMQSLNTGYAASVPGSAAAMGGGLSASDILQGVSLFGQGFSTMSSGLSQAAAIEGQKRLLEVQMATDRAASAQEELNSAKRLQALIAYNKAQAGASGLTVAGFAPVQEAVMSEDAHALSVGRFNRDMLAYQRQIEGSTLSSKARNAKRGSLFKAATQTAGAVGDILERGIY